MLLTIETTLSPATDLGYLLHKHPDRVQTFSLNFGSAHVFYPIAREDHCQAVLLLDVDPVGLVRKRGRPSGNQFALDQYVNDRPYVASSFLSVAISQVFKSALNGSCKARPELVTTSMPLKVKISVLPCRGGEDFLRKLFEPLGYIIDATHHPLDEQFPEWGDGAYFTVTLEARTTLQLLLTHLYVLIPVLDNDKHYWVGPDEVEKLLSRGEGWLSSHPERELITQRYLKYQRGLAREAMARLTEDDDPDPDATEELHAHEEEAIEKPLSLQQQRMGAVVAVLKSLRAHRILDLGCGEGSLLRELLREKQFSEILGMDVSIRALEKASGRLKLDRLPPLQRARIKLIHGSLIYRDERLTGYDAAAVVEVIEHLDPPRLAAFETLLFGHTRPQAVIVTTPNIEYNVRWETLPTGSFRHRDHRFEWTRQEFKTWAQRIADNHNYRVRFLPIGPDDPEVGAPTQMGVFEQ